MWSLTTKECPTWFVSVTFNLIKLEIANFGRGFHCALSCFLAALSRVLAQGPPTISKKLGEGIEAG
jgi:hypothetical protein